MCVGMGAGGWGGGNNLCVKSGGVKKKKEKSGSVRTGSGELAQSQRRKMLRCSAVLELIHSFIYSFNKRRLNASKGLGTSE